MILITIVHGVYKPTYNWGGPTLYDSKPFFFSKAARLFLDFVGYRPTLQPHEADHDLGFQQREVFHLRKKHD